LKGKRILQEAEEIKKKIKSVVEQMPQVWVMRKKIEGSLEERWRFHQRWLLAQLLKD
jgi:hypothetical protein